MIKPLIIDYYENAKKEITAKINSTTAPYEIDQLIKEFARDYFLPTVVKDDQKEQIGGSEIRNEMVDGKQVEVAYIVIGIPIVGSYVFEPHLVRTFSGGVVINNVIADDFGGFDQTEKKIITAISLYPKENAMDITYRDYYGGFIVIQSRAIESELIEAKDKVIKSLQSRNKEIIENNNKLLKFIEELAKKRREILMKKGEDASELTYNLRDKISDIKW